VDLHRVHLRRYSFLFSSLILPGEGNTQDDGRQQHSAPRHSIDRKSTIQDKLDRGP
jgi:hypothetical protein